MGLKGGVYSAMVNDKYSRFIIHPDDVYKASRGKSVRVYIDGTALLYVHLITWKNHQDSIEEEDAAEMIPSLTEYYCEKLNSEIKKYARKLLLTVNHPDLYFSLTFDDRSRRPPNKEQRKSSVNIQPQVNSYIEYLRNVKENVFGNYTIVLLSENEDDAGYGCCGESDFQIVNAICNDDETDCHIIYSNDSDYFAFSYRRDQRLFFFSPGSEKVYDLSHLSTALVHTLVPVAAIGGCDYGTPAILGKDKSDLGKQLKELFATASSYKNLLLFDRLISDHLAAIRHVGVDEFVGGVGDHCCEVDVLKQFVLYFDELYKYYIYLQPFTMSSEYFKWKICRRDAYMCILLYLHFRPINNPSQMFTILDRLFKPRYVYHFKVSSLFIKGEDEEVDRSICYVREKMTY